MASTGVHTVPYTRMILVVAGAFAFVMPLLVMLVPASAPAVPIQPAFPRSVLLPMGADVLLIPKQNSGQGLLVSTTKDTSTRSDEADRTAADVVAVERLAAAPSPSSDTRSWCESHPSSCSLARSAMQWLSANLQQMQKADFPSSNHYRVVVDYTALSDENYTLAWLQPSKWTFITAFAPAVHPFSQRKAPNQHAWAPPNDLNLRTLWSSMNLFDTQLLLRPSYVLEHMSNVTLHELIGNTVALARVTYLILPCEIEFADEADELKQIHSAVRWVRQQEYLLGVRSIEVNVTAIRRFVHDGGGVGGSRCHRSLLEVSIRKIVKGTRHTWCYYTGGHKAGTWVKFVMHYEEYRHIRVMRDSTTAMTTAEGKVLRNWLPNINLGDFLGWGLTRSQRVVAYWDMLQQPPWPDYNVHNWVISSAGRIERIDFDIKSFKKHPMGRPYPARIRSFLCLPPTQTPDEGRCRSCSQCMATATFAFKALPPRICRTCLNCVQRSQLAAYRSSPELVNGTFASCVGHRPPNPSHLFVQSPEMCTVGRMKP
eukprot:NODE_684_length_1984_cov_36.349354_g632_i0.p1 GENE.NODE_684_length_1984_cov_36.349354_g632_i0~~NODE_684_length_1984_cov_36.349354_g632_i0.p1  ORF type:complete len:540 (+),score=53.22 NODE_684_length_1984_cov_36.349354_g632_i0:134-1753(+)